NATTVPGVDENPGTVITQDFNTGATAVTNTTVNERTGEALVPQHARTVTSCDTIPDNSLDEPGSDMELMAEDEDESTGSPLRHGDIGAASTAERPFEQKAFNFRRTQQETFAPQQINHDSVMMPSQETPSPDEAGIGEPAHSLTQSIRNKAKSAIGSVLGHYNKDEPSDPMVEQTITTTARSTTDTDPTPIP